MIKSHATSHKIVTQTSRTDLESLVDRALLEKRKIGKGNVYFPVHDLSAKLHED